MTSAQVFVGIDVSKAQLDVALRPKGQFSAANDEAGWDPELPIHIGPGFKKEHVHGMALNTMEDAKGADAIGFQPTRLKLQGFAKRGMKTQKADRFFEMFD
jgi:hypothetical protein